MNSILQVLAVCLLLKACAANFNQALQDPKCHPKKNGCDLPLLETLSVVVGNYSNAHQMSRHQQHYGELFVDAVDADYVPLDIPALNQYHPVLYVQVGNGGRSRVLLKLISVDEIGQYISQAYSLPDLDKYLSGELDFADLTWDDVVTLQPLCTGVLVRRKDIVVGLIECLLDTQGNSVVYSVNYVCDSLDAVFGKGTPELFRGIAYHLNKTEKYSLPDSWLIGYEDYVNPCEGY